MGNLTEADLYNLSAKGVDLAAHGLSTASNPSEAQLANLYNTKSPRPKVRVAWTCNHCGRHHKWTWRELPETCEITMVCPVRKCSGKTIGRLVEVAANEYHLIRKNTLA